MVDPLQSDATRMRTCWRDRAGALSGVVPSDSPEGKSPTSTYPSIVAGGSNTYILRYTNNQNPLRDGDLLLIDAGCSLMDYYNADMTRTFPINGQFSGSNGTSTN